MFNLFFTLWCVVTVLLMSYGHFSVTPRSVESRVVLSEALDRSSDVREQEIAHDKVLNASLERVIELMEK